MDRGRSVAVGLILGALLLARALATFVPAMWAWGINSGRFLHPAAAWGLWLVAASALLPATRGGWTRLADRIGDAIVRSPLAWPVAAAAGAVLVFALPDRTWFIGDFQIRAGAAEVPGAFPGNFSGAMPLDRFLHGTLAGPLSAAFGPDPTLAARFYGAVEAAGLALLAVALARHLGHGGAVALMIVCVMAAGGYLTTFTGLGKPAREMVLFTVATGVFGAIAVRDPRARLGAGLALAAALLTHRSAVMLLPAWIVSWLAGIGTEERATRPAGRAVTTLALLIPIGAAAITFGRIDQLLRGYDVTHHLAPAAVERIGGPLRAALDPVRLADIVSLLVVMVPAVLVLPAFLGGRGPSGGRPAHAREGVVIATLALAALPVWLFVHPQQGVFRDWDVFAAAGAALALFAAFVLGEGLRGRPDGRWIAAALAVITLTSTLGWLLLAHRSDRGLARVRAWLTEAPERPEVLRATTWDFVAGRELRLGRYGAAADAAARAAALAPHRRLLLTWGIAATMARDHVQAARAYRTLLERAPDDPLGWLGLAGAALRSGDSATTRAALARLEDVAPRSPEAEEIRRHATFFPEVWPGLLPEHLRRP